MSAAHLLHARSLWVHRSRRAEEQGLRVGQIEQFAHGNSALGVVVFAAVPLPCTVGP